MVGLGDGVTSREDLAVGRVQQRVHEVSAEEGAGDAIDARGLVYQAVKLHDAVAGHVVEQQGQRQPAVDSQLLERGQT